MTSDLKATNHLLPCAECKAGFYPGDRYRCAVCGTLSKREQIAAVRAQLGCSLEYIKDSDCFFEVTRNGASVFDLVEYLDFCEGESKVALCNAGPGGETWDRRARLARQRVFGEALNVDQALDLLAERVWEAERKPKKAEEPTKPEAEPKAKAQMTKALEAVSASHVVVVDAEPEVLQLKRPAFKVGDVVTKASGATIRLASPYAAQRAACDGDRLATIDETLAEMERRGWIERVRSGNCCVTWGDGLPVGGHLPYVRMAMADVDCPEEAQPWLRHLIRMMEGAS